MPKQWSGRYLILFCLLIGTLALTACGPISIWQPAAPQRSLARDGGARLTLHVACLLHCPQLRPDETARRNCCRTLTAD